MSKMYSKPGGGKSTILYDSNGKVVGRGVTDSNGRTIYTGTNGQYIGKSYQTPSGTTKFVDADNNYVGTGIPNSGGASKIDTSGGKPIGGGDSSNQSHSYGSQPVGDGCASSIVWFVIICAILFIINLLN